MWLFCLPYIQFLKASANHLRTIFHSAKCRTWRIFLYIQTFPIFIFRDNLWFWVVINDNKYIFIYLMAKNGTNIGTLRPLLNASSWLPWFVLWFLKLLGCPQKCVIDFSWTIILWDVNWIIYIFRSRFDLG